MRPGAVRYECFPKGLTLNQFFGFFISHTIQTLLTIFSVLQSTPEYIRSGRGTRMAKSYDVKWRNKVDATMSHLCHGQENTLQVLQQLLSRLEQPREGEASVHAPSKRRPIFPASDTPIANGEYRAAAGSPSPHQSLGCPDTVPNISPGEVSTIESCGTHILTPTPSSGSTHGQVPSDGHYSTQLDIQEALIHIPTAHQRLEEEVRVDPKEPFDCGTEEHPDMELLVDKTQISRLLLQ